CAARAAKLPGAFVECGVNRGGFARAIIAYTAFERLGKSYYLFDTFAGFDEDQLSPEERATIPANYRYEDCYADVQREFSRFECVKLVRGSVPVSLQQVNVGHVAFL